GRIAKVRLDRPERKNPLTFDSYAELRDTFRDLVYADDVDAVVFLSNGGNFCSGGDVHDIIGPLVNMDMKQLLAFTFAHGITKTQLNQEWSMGLDQAIEAEAQAQAICMQTRDFERAYKAFVAKEKPVFEGD
ncbi:MAG: hypothetical protein E5Y29_26630, partial [Mesorhizobium sp.]